MDLSLATFDELRDEMLRRSSEGIIACKLYSDVEPQYYYKGYTEFCIAMLNEMMRNIDPLSSEEVPE